MKLQKRDTVAGHHTIHLVEADPGQLAAERPAFLFVHGIGVSNWYFRPLMRQLADDFHVVALDLPGFGRSDNPDEQLNIQDYGRILNDFIGHEQLDEPILAGHSMGCQIVAEAARQQPGVASKLVLMGPTIARGKRSVGQQAARLLLDASREPLRTTAVVTADYIRCSTRRYIQTIRPMLEDRLEDRLPHVDPDAEILVLRGSRDPIATREWCETLAGRTPLARLVEIPGAAHNVQHARPADVAAVLRDFALQPGEDRKAGS